MKCILFGLKLAASLFPNAWFVIIAVGGIRGRQSLLANIYVQFLKLQYYLGVLPY
jgi:hypothetical protein